MPTTSTSKDNPFRGIVCLMDHANSPEPFSNIDDLEGWLADNRDKAVWHVRVAFYRPAPELDDDQSVVWEEAHAKVGQNGDERVIECPSNRIHALYTIFGPCHGEVTA